ncbi:uncharacterized protein [Pagrus major]|uniref:uncharacterized protein n=1 Tax=Pagrus major TaxID=143350 RepID=UPI003CC83EEA
MSLTMGKSDGVTVVTLTTDPESSCPPLCQIFKSLCYSQACCSVSQHLRRVQRSSQSVLGALHIMDGLLTLGLGMIIWSQQWWKIDHFWLGPIFILFGIVNIVSEKYPSRCLVILNVIVNLVGVAFAIAAIVLHSISIGYMYFYGGDCSYRYNSRYHTASPHEDIIRKKCEESRALAIMLIRCISAVLIVLAVLELCVAISSVVLGIKALRNSKKTENKSTDDAEHYKELLEEVTSNPTA